MRSYASYEGSDEPSRQPKVVSEAKKSQHAEL